MILFNHKGYVGYAEFDEEAGIFSGHVINISQDVVTFWGETVEESKTEFMISVDGYLEFCQQQNRLPEPPNNNQNQEFQLN
ncbi:MAG: hypothetical protein U1V55_21955 [Planktothrix rubescens PR222]